MRKYEEALAGGEAAGRAGQGVADSLRGAVAGLPPEAVNADTVDE
jgi:hypothetical protein